MAAKRVALMMGSDLKRAEPYEAALRFVGLDPLLSPRSLHDVEGVVLGGGVDINPALYHEDRKAETEEPDDARDAREMDIVQKALKAELPILAICRGMQLFNVALGGTLIQHIGYTHRKKGVPDAHPIAVHADSQLAKILEAETFSVNSRHHQATCLLGKGLRVSAWCPADDIVEALEDPGRRFAVGVQWHPEDRVTTHTGDQRLFEAFARAIAENRR